MGSRNSKITKDGKRASIEQAELQAIQNLKSAAKADAVPHGAPAATQESSLCSSDEEDALVHRNDGPTTTSSEPAVPTTGRISSMESGPFIQTHAFSDIGITTTATTAHTSSHTRIETGIADYRNTMELESSSSFQVLKSAINTPTRPTSSPSPSPRRNIGDSTSPSPSPRNTSHSSSSPSTSQRKPGQSQRSSCIPDSRNTSHSSARSKPKISNANSAGGIPITNQYNRPIAHASKSNSPFYGNQSSKDQTIRRRRDPYNPRLRVFAPPVYIDNSGGSRSGGCGGGRGGSNGPIDRLRNVDVIEELCYCVPGEPAAPQSYDYYNVNECGELEFVSEGPTCPGEATTNPVTYTKRQRFNFKSKFGEDDDGPPFAWPYGSNACKCNCCVGGRGRDPKCECDCCNNGKARRAYFYDELPVGKNPEVQRDSAVETDDMYSATDLMKRGKCDGIVPSNSGIYYFDAEKKRFFPHEQELVVEEPMPMMPPVSAVAPQMYQAPPPLPPPQPMIEYIEHIPPPVVQPIIMPSCGGGGGCCGGGGGCGGCGFGNMGMNCCGGMNNSCGGMNNNCGGSMGNIGMNRCGMGMNCCGGGGGGGMGNMGMNCMGMGSGMGMNCMGMGNGNNCMPMNGMNCPMACPMPVMMMPGCQQPPPPPPQMPFPFPIPKKKKKKKKPEPEPEEEEEEPEETIVETIIDVINDIIIEEPSEVGVGDGDYYSEPAPLPGPEGDAYSEPAPLPVVYDTYTEPPPSVFEIAPPGHETQEGYAVESQSQADIKIEIDNNYTGGSNTSKTTKATTRSGRDDDDVDSLEGLGEDEPEDPN